MAAGHPARGGAVLRASLAGLALLPLLARPLAAAEDGPTTIRTESYPRPPYSGATYYVYERGGRTICTKLSVCNKYDQCQTTYRRGAYREPLDVETGEPYGTTPPETIAPGKLSKHACLTKFGLL